MRTLLFYKPFEVLSQFSASENKKTLADFLHGLPKDCYPIGRLDYDSEGLIVISNDKSLSHRLTDPRFAHPRRYLVQVEGLISDEAIRQLSEGVTLRIDGKIFRTKPALATRLSEEPMLPPRNPPIRFRKSVPTSWLSLTLTEGRNRQVRRMTAAVGYPTLRLIRAAIGPYTLEGLTPGTLRDAPVP